MPETRVFFGPTPKSTRDYVEWFNSMKFETVEVSIAARPYVEGGSETVIIVVYVGAPRNGV